MKLLKVNFKNINSLAGEWTIDFESPEFLSDVFVISGPTGSGKTSILDAITLALYGRTGRQQKNTEGNCITRGFGEASSIVEFIGIDGEKYSATWKQSRARGKADGNLQQIKRRLISLKTGEDLSLHKKNDIEVQIVSAIGLSFEQFIRSAVLQQGKFASFLTAKPVERASILEKATRTTQFSEAGIKIHAFYKKVKSDLEDVRAVLDNQKSDEAAFSKESEEKALQRLEEVKTLSCECDKLRAMLSDEQIYINEEENLTRRKHDFENKRAELERNEKDFAPSLIALSSATAARSLDAAYFKLSQERKALTEQENRIKNLKTKLDAIRNSLPCLQQNHDESLRTIESVKNEIASFAPTLEKARELDTAIASLTGEINALKQTKKEYETKHFDCEKQLIDCKKSLQLNEELKTALLSFEAEGIVNPPFTNNPIIKALVKAKETNNALALEDKTASDIVTELNHAVSILTNDEEHLNAALPGLEQALEYAKKIYDNAIISARLVDFRPQLKEGEPCPLCGSHNHPYKCDIDFSSMVTESKNDVENAQNAITNEKTKVEKSRKAVSQLRLKHLSATKRIASLREERDKARTLATEKRDAFFADAQRKRDLCENLTNNAKNSADALSAINLRINEITTRHIECSTQRFALLKTSVRDEEIRQRSIEDAAVNGYNTAKTKLSLSLENVSVLSHNLEQEDIQLATRIKEKTMAKNDFLRLAANNGFQSEQNYLSSRLSDDAFNQLQATQAELSKRKEAIASLDAALKNDFENHLSKKPPVLHDNLKELIESENKKRTELDKEHGELNKTIAEIFRQRNAFGATQEKARKLEIKFNKVSHLNKLFGGENGDAFQRYAQGVTLSKLLLAANDSLALMSKGRYELCWNPDAKNELLPDIIDHWQLKTVRPVSNLSGGETFLVSLSLALGLGGLSGKELSIESLFLDEGFGTLDEEKLSLAIKALTKRHKEGCHIGIITHVDAVKNMGLDAIEIIPVRDGISRIEGPGVQKN